ncbi:MAG TPA: enoyl-CoA hydratase/isomerase family protein [Polyangia bacterium]
MIDVVDHGPVRELRLARPPVNALNPGLMSALRGAVAQGIGAGQSALVLSGSPGVFSAGLDVPALLALDRAALRSTWELFFGLLSDLAHCPLPIAAALTGHSPAGGTVLALFADHRVMAEGNFRIGLNEVQVGLPVPAVLLRALTFWCGERTAARLAVGGLLIDPAEALRAGLVDEVLPVADVVPRAVAWAQDLLQRPPVAMRGTRALVRQPLQQAFASVDAAMIDGVVEQWHSPETQAVLKGLVARLSKKAPG